MDPELCVHVIKWGMGGMYMVPNACLKNYRWGIGVKLGVDVGHLLLHEGGGEGKNMLALQFRALFIYLSGNIIILMYEEVGGGWGGGRGER